ncbi:hypothetical protein ACFQY4_39765 [Catellatospora bangladeshensis]|uniref:Uncharacterized protein n=1 Tax=Catellatospora bangladeshensis TaxID=310355 RepID=A0A8J3JV89_9ACTN|nr:hypothetical protein [Catellatospora bangladeshensis]GIF85755.1 hypothetical protein Cba03nite_71040 [Catellatospora bangladeshensis]
MGRIVKQLSETTTKYYWYPGEKQEWIRAVVAVSSGAGAAALLMMLTRNSLAAVVVGCSVTLAVSGFNFGRRDAKALAGWPKLSDKAARRAAVAHSGRAAWRASAHGVGGAVAAIVVLNLTHSGWVADWLLPVVPAVVGALAHQTGMVWEQLASTVATTGPAAAPATPAAKPTAD